ncbi:protein of unknown function DUF92 transmembrane [Gemmatirosa kalamazoonensis]|uniref:DUF92 domain-containing protein n=1 Tax=Gemmatirosa kalamazoonensis TaxID=861299 RepID=W0RMN3_9BACT|nr:DUF92 domain-containing protein [Gemmatirosa kalamazoonensis]AHG91717.1 protein of unknown function DUF92 transmembrane [Gemmatirosa kalamazoonensis]
MPLSALVDDVWARAAAGLALAAAIALAARRARSLSPSGAVAAVVVGTAAIAAGWRYGALLIVYFVASSLLSRWRAVEKARRTGGVVEKGGERDARQVLANGAAFTVCALATLGPIGSAARPWEAAAAGALAAATADTWATEIGTLARRAPISLATLRTVPPGTSGAVSVPGTLALALGAVVVGALARALGIAAAWPVAAGGAAGAVADTLLGAALQERRWCARCDRATEQRVHACGMPTIHAGGVRGVDNDAVNLACTVVGAATGALLAGAP